MDIFGKRERQNPDWFEAGIVELEPVIEAKRKIISLQLWQVILFTARGLQTHYIYDILTEKVN